MRHSDWFRVCAVLVAAWAVVGCHEVRPGLEEACIEDPMVRECRTDACATAYECVSYCLEHFPEHPAGEAPPESGMGSWCDDARLPADLGDFCNENRDVIGCQAWCEANPGRCGDAPDGDADADGDGDGDADADGDGDADADGDGDADGDADEDGDSDGDVDADGDGDLEPECRTDEDCTEASVARCLDGTCVPCSVHSNCAHIGGRPACVDGGCAECATDYVAGCSPETPRCNPDTNRCVECLDHSQCGDPEAARCERNRCTPCRSDEHCEGAPGRPACMDGTCYECTFTNMSECGGETPECHGLLHVCVECVVDVSCRTPEAAGCSDTFECIPCVVNGECASVPGELPICDDGTCVRCTEEEDWACPGDAPLCRETDHSCVECLDDGDCRDLGCGREWCEDGSCRYDDDLDDDGSPCIEDCDDDDPDNFPGNVETCDGVDNDCDWEPEREFAVAVPEARMSEPGHHAWNPDTAWSGDLQLVVWCESDPETARSTPHAAFVEDDGAVTWRGALDPTTEQCLDTAVAWTGTTFAVVWTSPSAIRGVLLAPDGRVVGEPVEVVASDGYSIAIAHSEGRPFRIAWSTPSSDRRVHTVELDETLSPTGLENLVGDCNEHGFPSVVAHEGGSLVLCGEVQAAGSSAIWQQAFTAAGIPRAARRVSEQATPPRLRTAGGVWVDDHYVASWWVDELNTIYARQIDGTGAFIDGAHELIDLENRPTREIFGVGVGAANTRGSAAGFGVAVVLLDATRLHLHAVRSDSNGYSIGEALHLAPMGGNRPDMFIYPSVHEDRQGLAVSTWVNDSSDLRILFTTVETCF